MPNNQVERYDVSAEEMTVTSEVSGRCNKLYADESQAVPQSGKLAEIDTTFLKLELEANKMAIEQALRKLNQEKKIEYVTKEFIQNMVSLPEVMPGWSPTNFNQR